MPAHRLRTGRGVGRAAVAEIEPGELRPRPRLRSPRLGCMSLLYNLCVVLPRGVPAPRTGIRGIPPVAVTFEA